MVWLSHAYCFAMGKMAMLMFTRSMLQSMNATKHSATMVYRRCHRDAALAGLACSRVRCPVKHPKAATTRDGVLEALAQRHRALLQKDVAPCTSAEGRAPMGRGSHLHHVPHSISHCRCDWHRLV